MLRFKMDTAEKSTLDFKITDATSYDAHVGDFQRFSAALTTPLARRMIAMADISDGERVIGVGVVELEVLFKGRFSEVGLPASSPV